MCPFVWLFSQRRLWLYPPEIGPEQRRMAFFLIDAPTVRDEVISRAAVRLAACYRVHNTARYQATWSPQVMQEMLPQAARDLVRGHARASAALDSAWRHIPDR